MAAATEASPAHAALDFLDSMFAELDVPERWRELLRLHLDEGRDQAARHPLPAAELPLAVAAAVGLDREAALPVAGACLLVYLGADLLDNVADDELPERWRSIGQSETLLAATTLLAPLPHLALARLPAGTPVDIRLRLGHELAATLLEMSAGQHDDIAAPEPWTAEACRAMIARKSGAGFGLYASAGALVGRADAATVGHYRRFGRALGTGGQIASDLGEVLEPDGSRDLFAGKRTLPVVHALDRLEGPARERLEVALQIARDTPDAHPEVMATLTAAGSIRYTGLVVELYRQEARRQLEAAAPREPGASWLARLVDEASVLPEAPAPAGE